MSERWVTTLEGGRGDGESTAPARVDEGRAHRVTAWALTMMACAASACGGDEHPLVEPRLDAGAAGAGGGSGGGAGPHAGGASVGGEGPDAGAVTSGAGADASTGGSAAGGAAGASSVGGSASAPDSGGDAGADTPEPSFTMRVLASGLASPWEISWGPDAMLWVTERAARRILRVDPDDGSISAELTIEEATQSSAQDGLLGLAVHPGLVDDPASRFVYVAYTYDEASPGDAGVSSSRRAKLRRYTFDADSRELSDPIDLLTSLPASEDHNSGRLLFGPDQRLYYTVGDQGSNQFATVCNPVRAQDLPSDGEIEALDYGSYAGKILRLELDGSIPADNPLLAGVRSHVYSYGHRNAQGIAFADDGQLYSDEHGAKTDDELNLILPGKNYGWPHVSGYRDDLAYVYGNWSASSPTPCAELTYSDYVVPESVPVSSESAFDAPDFVAPLLTFYTVPSDHEFVDPACGGNDYICWPTIAPSSLDFYGPGGAIAGWERSLLISSLKQGAVYRVQLAPDGRSVVGEAEPVLKTQNRYRDLAVAPGGAVIYVVTDAAGGRVGPAGGYASESEQPGSILELRYTGPT